MITGWQNRLDSLLQEQSPQEFAVSVVDLFRSADNLTEFIERTGRLAASCAPREEYSRYVPNGYMAFIGAVRMGRYVQPLIHLNALAQALWCCARENATAASHWTAPSPPASADPDSILPCLETHWREKDSAALHASATAGVSNESTREETLRWLLRTAAGDLSGGGNKYLYLAECVELCAFLGWRNIGDFLFPAIHSLVEAPEDRRAEQILNARLAHHGLRLEDRSFDQYTLSTSQTLQIRDSILHDSQEDVLDTLLGAMDYGYDPRSVAEGLLVTAAHGVLAVPYDRWLFPVQGFNCCEAVVSTLEYHDRIDQQRLVLFTGLLLKQIVESAMPFRVSEPFFVERPEEAQPLPMELEEAIDLSIPADAMAIVDWLFRRGYLTPELFERFVASAAKTDGDLHLGHDLKFAFATIDAFHCCSTPLRESFLLALVKFLAESQKSRQINHALAQALRA